MGIAGKRMNIRLIVAATLALALLLAFGAGAVSEGGGDALVYLRMSDAIDLDPWRAREVYSSEVACNVFEGLVRFAGNGVGIEPCLATAWQVEAEGRRWRFDLRRDVRFHDGTSFDSHAVVLAFRKSPENEAGAMREANPLFSSVSGVRSLGPYGVEITLHRPYAPFLVALADSTAFIVSPTARAAGSFRPIGTGPFRFQSWTRGRALVLARNPDYWGGIPPLAKVIFKVMADAPGRIMQIKNGGADVAKILSGKEYDELALRSDVAILRQPIQAVHYLGFNARHHPFDRQEVRAAFLHTIDKGVLVREVFQNTAEPAYAPLPPGMPAGVKAAPVSSFNLRVARILLQRAGLPDGFRCRLFLPEGTQGQEEVADILVLMARKVGITITKVKLPFDRLMAAVYRGEHELLLSGWSTAPDPDLFLTPLFSSAAGGRIRFSYDNPELSALLDRGRTMLVPLQRAGIYAEALSILKKDVPWIPLYHPLNVVACRRSISGLLFTPLGHVLFREASKADR